VFHSKDLRNLAIFSFAICTPYTTPAGLKGHEKYTRPLTRAGVEPHLTFASEAAPMSSKSSKSKSRRKPAKPDKPDRPYDESGRTNRGALAGRGK
jgi:hypothetical protein